MLSAATIYLLGIIPNFTPLAKLTNFRSSEVLITYENYLFERRSPEHP